MSPTLIYVCAIPLGQDDNPSEIATAITDGVLTAADAIPNSRLGEASFEISPLGVKAALLDVTSKARNPADWLTPFDGSGIEWHESLPSPYTYQESDFSKLVAAVHEYESRLKTMPNLEAALRKIAEGEWDDDSYLAGRVRDFCRDTLAGLESE